MITLKKDLFLYHGSYTPVEEIDLSKCVPHKDFGQGFYVTSSFDQAKSFIRLSLNRAKMKKQVDPLVKSGYVSIFQFNFNENLRIKYFNDADIEWLHFVVANRDSECFPDLLRTYRDYNIIVGKIANDRTATTLQAYIENVYGKVGTKEADARAFATLLPNKLEDQICFKSDDAIASLHFIRSEFYEL